MRNLVMVFALLMGLVMASGGLAPVAADPNRLVIETETGQHAFTVEMAVTPEEQARGLMFRREMAADHGMLFDFRAEREASFWMRNTYLPLDMIFVRADGTVHRIARDTVPLSEEAVRSNGPVRAVFEVLAGTSQRIGLRPGDRIVHPIFTEDGAAS